MSNITRGDTKTSLKTGLLGILTAGALTTSLSGCIPATVIGLGMKSQADATRDATNANIFMINNAETFKRFYEFKASASIGRTIQVGRHLLNDKSNGTLYLCEPIEQGVLFEPQGAVLPMVIPYHQIDRVIPTSTLTQEFIKLEFTANNRRLEDAYLITSRESAQEVAQYISSRRDLAKKKLANAN